jgi:zinc transport system ATP-binding protein
MEGNSILKVNNLNVGFDKNLVIEDLSFNVQEGEALAVIGPNGAGKTTLFRALLGITGYRGEIKWKEGTKIGYVPQRMEIETDVPLTVIEFLRLRQAENFTDEKAKEAIRSVSLSE